MSLRVAIQVTLAGAVLGAWILACVGNDYPPPAAVPDAATEASAPPDTAAPPAPPAASCTCVESPADGWSVPGYLLRDATCAAPVPMEAYKLYTDVSGEPATCGHCSCKSQPTYTECAAPSIASYTSGTCPAGAPTGTPLHLTAAGCYANPNPTITSYRAETGLVQGLCDATSDAVPVIPPMQKTEFHLCVAAGPGAGTCATGTACRPDPPAGSTPPPLCVAHPGDVECPDGYPTRQRLNATYEDKRRCTTCYCSFSGSGCTYSVKAYSAAGCTGTLLTTATSGPTCLTGSPKSYRVTEGTVTNATCGNPQGGDPTGEVEVSDPVTVCCKP